MAGVIATPSIFSMTFPALIFDAALSAGPPSTTSATLTPSPVKLKSYRRPRAAVSSVFGRLALKRPPVWLAFTSPSISLSISAKS